MHAQKKSSAETSSPDLDREIRRLQKLCGRAPGSERHALRRQVRRLSKGGGPIARRLAALENRIQAAIQRRQWRAENRPRVDYPAELPITARRKEIVDAIRTHSVVVISGDTGSGKSTQIPKFCLEAGRGVEGLIGCTQPRRIAAITLANRIAEELGEQPGKSVGHKIRFQDATSGETFIKLMTDGILLAEAQADRWLNAYDTIIVDEAHERSLNIDFVLGMLKTLVRRRRDLKLIITSATIDTEKFSNAFDDAPVIEVSGRTYPVEVDYQPPEPGDEDATHVDLAVATVDRLQRERPYGGDILVFMPTEQDIRETCELLEAKNHMGLTVLPLFARLSAGDQSRVFSPVRGRKVIVATNVAETSLTIPGIRYVVDTGLARISQYQPRTRTTALPVAPIARSSADQRKGRCGRTAGGVCIRLYEEEDYESRPRFTPPEILRSNLAEVILRMLDLRLGDVAAFPFIDRPADRNIQDGFRMLEELGAVRRREKDRRGATHALTDRGRLMARLPLDPRISRMLLEGKERGVLPPVTVLAAALSIQDPRERPAEKEAQADQAHARFVDPRSDFLTLLNIWTVYHEHRAEGRGTSRMRKFCKAHFLSFRRMREWRDVHYQLRTILQDNDLWAEASEMEREAKGEGFSPWYAAIHQSVLSGFLSSIAQRKEGNFYQAARNREVMLFPGSGLFNRGTGWVVAAEMVETSRLFARTVAAVDSDWLEPLAGDLVRRTYRNAHWEKNRGEVVASEQVTLFGLTLVGDRPVSYGRIDPPAAREIFIRSGLVEGEIQRPPGFVRHNRAEIAAVRELEDRMRRRDLLIGEEALFDFYDQRIPAEITDLAGLRKWLRGKKSDTFLRMRREALMAYRPEADLAERFPERVSLENTVLPVDYRFDPGEDADGVTLRVSAAEAGSVRPAVMDWLVPGLFREKVETLVKGLPKGYRKQLVPVSDTVTVIAEEMPRQPEVPLATALSGFVHRRFGVDVPASAWPLDALPDHLRMRVSVRGAKGEELRAGRDPALLRGAAPAGPAPDRFEQAKAEWERDGVTDWDVGELPDSIVLEGKGPEQWTAYPALAANEAGGVDVRLFRSRGKALAAHRKGVARLVERRSGSLLRTLARQVSLPKDAAGAAQYFGGAKAMEAALAERVVAEVFEKNVRDEVAFEAHAEAAGTALLKAGTAKRDAVVRVLKAYAEARGTIYDLENSNRRNPGIIRFLSDRRDDLANLAPEHFVSLYDTERLKSVARYLQAVAVRAERGAVSPEKDAAKAKEVAVHEERLAELLKGLGPETTPEKRAAVEAFYWSLEEFKVSVFAQELGTAEKVSSKRLTKRFEEIRRMV